MGGRARWLGYPSTGFRVEIRRVWGVAVAPSGGSCEMTALDAGYVAEKFVEAMASEPQCSAGAGYLPCRSFEMVGIERV